MPLEERIYNNFPKGIDETPTTNNDLPLIVPQRKNYVAVNIPLDGSFNECRVPMGQLVAALHITYPLLFDYQLNNGNLTLFFTQKPSKGHVDLIMQDMGGINSELRLELHKLPAELHDAFHIAYEAVERLHTPALPQF